MLLLPAPKTTIVQTSGGMSSAYALKLALETETKVQAVFADVKGSGLSHFWSDLPSIEALLHERFGGESRDTYRFLWQVSEALSTPIERLGDDRTIWTIAAKERMFRLFRGARSFCKASEVLKREVIAQWIIPRFQPGTFRLALGMDVLEPNRVTDARRWWSNRLGYEVEVYSPLIHHYQQTGKAIDRCQLTEWAESLGLDVPQAYRDDLPHNNCNKYCFMAGQTQYAKSYRLDPLGYQYAAWQEMRLNKAGRLDATILAVERDGVKRPISLYDFVGMIEAGEVNERDLGFGCSCVVYEVQLPLFELAA